MAVCVSGYRKIHILLTFNYNFRSDLADLSRRCSVFSVSHPNTAAISTTTVASMG